jgi:choloylglycine hydrolase
MCTAATYQTKDFYFGRNLDYEFSFGEEVTITPRQYPFPFSNKSVIKRHYALIGMAHIADHYPLYYEAVNEKGLGLAGLNFVGNAFYGNPLPNRDNIAPYELIPWILGQCASVREALPLLEKIQFVPIPFHDKLPVAELHWLLADRQEAVTIESVQEGIQIFQNPVGILTNNPPFSMQLFQLNRYMGLSPKNPQNHFSDKLSLHPYSRGMGGLGLPGDLSSPSRFVRASFVKMNSRSGQSELESVSQFFHILGSVEQPKGCCEVADGQYEFTQYTCCCNTEKGIYYYTSYDNHQITAVDMQKVNLDSSDLIVYPLLKGEQINYLNREATPS